MDPLIEQVEKLRTQAAAQASEAASILINLISKLGELTDTVKQGNELINTNDLETPGLETGQVGSLARPLIAAMQEIDRANRAPEFMGTKLTAQIFKAIHGGD